MDEHMIDNLLDKSDDELRDWLLKAISEAKPDKTYQQRLEEYRNNIERDFQTEWSHKHLKWLFTKRRQAKLRAEITRRYTAPLFWIVEDIIEETLVSNWQNSEFFGKFVEVKSDV